MCLFYISACLLLCGNDCLCLSLLDMQYHNENLIILYKVELKQITEVMSLIMSGGTTHHWYGPFKRLMHYSNHKHQTYASINKNTSVTSQSFGRFSEMFSRYGSLRNNMRAANG